MAINESPEVEKAKEKVRRKMAEGGSSMIGGGIGQLVEGAKKELSQLTGLQPSSLIGVSDENGEMTVKLEMVEKKSVPDSQDVLGIYDVKLTAEGKIKQFTRTRLRRRGDASFEE